MKYKHGHNIRKAFAVLFLCGLAALTGCGNRELEIATGTDAAEDGAEAQADEMPAGDVETAENTPEMDESGFYVTDDYVITVGDTINVRVEPNTDASIYELLTAGNVLKRTGYNDEWARVEIDLTSFYIYADYVEVTDPPETTEETTENAEEDDDAGDENSKEKTIVIDPGNQMSMNASTEQVGPGSEETKIGASAGVTGAAQGTTEYSLNLTYALALKEELEERGYTVAITRESNDVNMTNKERAEFANASGAVAYVRIKMNYSTNAALTGVMAATMGSESPYNAGLYDESHNLATRLLQGVCESTGATNHGIYESDDMTAVNWSDIPVAVIELGYLSNEEEEAKLLDADYQALVIKGLADGIDLYYN